MIKYFLTAILFALAINPAFAEDDQLAEKAFKIYYHAKDSGQYEKAYKMFAPDYKNDFLLDKFKSVVEDFNKKSGPVKERKINKISWVDNPPGGQGALEGKYAAVDFMGRFEKINKYCGYIIFRQSSTGELQVVREEENSMDNETEKQIVKKSSQQKADDAWRVLSSACPNYTAN